MCVCAYVQSIHCLPCATVRDICSRIPSRDRYRLLAQWTVSSQHTAHAHWTYLRYQKGKTGFYKYRLSRTVLVHLFSVHSPFAWYSGICKFLKSSFLRWDVLQPISRLSLIPTHRPHTIRLSSNLPHLNTALGWGGRWDAGTSKGLACSIGYKMFYSGQTVFSLSKRIAETSLYPRAPVQSACESLNTGVTDCISLAASGYDMLHSLPQHIL